MKQNPYLPALISIAGVLTTVGAIAFVVGLFPSSVGAQATSIAAFAFPAGVLTFLLWLTACAIAWRPSDG